jgi:hypothetical protein
MSVTGNRNVLLGSGAALPNAAGDDQIALGSADATVFVKNALKAGAITASGIILQGPLSVDAGTGGNSGAVATVLTSAGAGVPPTWQAWSAGNFAGVTATFTALGVETANLITVSGVAVGFSAGKLTTGVNNVIVGPYAASRLTAGYDNVAIGAGAMAAAAEANANSNVVIGSRAGAALTSSGCIVIGAGAATNPAAGANQIVLGTANSSLYVQGSLNYHVGDTIVGQGPPNVTFTLSPPLAQFYLIDSTVDAFNIRLPSVSTSKGAVVTFRRTGGTQNPVIFQPTNSEPIYPYNSTSTGVIIFADNRIQTQFICDGTSWYQLVN